MYFTKFIIFFQEKCGNPSLLRHFPLRESVAPLRHLPHAKVWERCPPFPLPAPPPVRSLLPGLKRWKKTLFPVGFVGSKTPNRHTILNKIVLPAIRILSRLELSTNNMIINRNRGVLLTIVHIDQQVTKMDDDIWSVCNSYNKNSFFPVLNLPGTRVKQCISCLVCNPRLL